MSATLKNLNVRTKRGKLIAEMNLVSRAEQGFTVKSPNRNKEQFRVWRDDRGRVRCSCPEFESEWQDDPQFRCEHILAVKYYLEATSEPTPPAAEPVPASTAHQEIEEEEEEFEPVAEHQPPAAPVRSAKAEPTAKAAKTETKAETKVESKTASQSVAAAVQQHEPPVDPEDSFPQVLKELSNPIPRELVRQRVGWTDRSGHEHEIDYIEWHTVADLLDRVYPEWSHSVKQLQTIGELVAVTASITIMGVTREGVGTGTAFDEKGIKKAESDALKRAAVKFGIARELYKKDEDDHNAAGDPPLLRFPRDPVARDIAEMATPKQHAAIRAIANAQGIDAEAECQERLNCKLAELSRRAASAFIDHLKSKQSLTA